MTSLEVDRQSMVKKLRALTNETCTAFKLAMAGDDGMLGKAVQQSLRLYALTGCHDIVLLGLNLAWHARKPDMVLEMFDGVYETSGDLRLFFSDLVFGQHVLSTEEIKKYEWLLKVTSKKFYVSDSQNVSLVDVPYQGSTLAAHAASLGRSTALLMLLRHGADPSKATMLLQPSFKSTNNWDYILRVILRALPHPTGRLLMLEPGLVLVPRLKHLCKIVLRNMLASTFCLPEGIYDLDIPTELMQYVDLLRDH